MTTTQVLFFTLFSSYFLFILFGFLFLIINILSLLLLLLQPSRALWLLDVVAEVKFWVVAEEDEILTLVVNDGLLALPSVGLCQR